ncbi:MAG: diguanylate cyclase domain-containing protein, partial [Aeromonas sp.]
MRKAPWRLQPTLTVILLLISLLPTLMTSCIFLYRRHQFIDDQTDQQLKRSFNRIQNDLAARIERLGPQLQLMSYNRSLEQALLKPKLAPLAQKPLSIFVQANPLISAAYLLTPDGRVITHEQGRPKRLAVSDLIAQFKMWSGSHDAKAGLNLLLNVDDPRLIGAKQRLGGVAIVAPIYRANENKGTLSIRGFLLLISPWERLMQVFESTMSPDEYFTVQLGDHQLYTSATDKFLSARDGVPLAHAGTLNSGWPQLPQLGSTPATLTLYRYRNDSIDALNRSQQWLIGGIAITLLLLAGCCLFLSRWLTSPLQALAQLVCTYALGNYRPEQPNVRFAEYDEIRQLLFNMGGSLSDQIERYGEQTEKLERISAERLSLNERLQDFNEKLAANVSEQTTALRVALNREERSRHILQSWLQFGLYQSRDTSLDALTRSGLQQLSQLYPGHRWGLVCRVDERTPYCTAFGMNPHTSLALHHELSRLVLQDGERFEHLWDDEHWLLFGLPSGHSNDLLGYLMVSSQGFEHEDRATLRLFAKQLSMEVEARIFNDELARVARTDTLTGLPNRQAFDEAFTHYQAVLARHPEQALALFMLDLNGLKQANDQYGHEAGDTLLKEMANTLRRYCRQNEQIFRMGGDEFVLL